MKFKTLTLAALALSLSSAPARAASDPRARAISSRRCLERVGDELGVALRC